jgi:hypothetical protein
MDFPKVRKAFLKKFTTAGTNANQYWIDAASFVRRRGEPLRSSRHVLMPSQPACLRITRICLQRVCSTICLTARMELRFGKSLVGPCAVWAKITSRMSPYHGKRRKTCASRHRVEAEWSDNLS